MPVHRGSRYHDLPRLSHQDATGREVPHLAPRIIRRPEAVRMHVVREGERTDLLADRYFADPERFWRICDAELVLWAEDLVARPGRRIRIPRGEG